ncbi:MAG: hypothetical protein GY795_19600, partial [Desulfobacterales bacterium]|nr:hypothetical protein [Desulfobacterales bacterium]
DLAVRMGTQVRATDGRVGEVNEFVVNPENWQITHMVLREGLPWDKKQVSIPVSEIERIEEHIDSAGGFFITLIPKNRNEDILNNHLSLFIR